MSRIGNAPIQLPQQVKVQIEQGSVVVEGSRGALSQDHHPDITIQEVDRVLWVTRPSDGAEHRAHHGLTRALLANMVTGVSDGFRRTLELVGAGYRVQQSGDNVVLQVGHSHPVEMVPLPGLTLTVEGNNRVHVEGIDKQAVGEMAARIRKVRKPNAYTGKGIRYMGERVRLKPGKAAGRKA